MLAAGHSTTSRALSVAIHYLATHPDDQATLRADPDRIPTAVEEFLRIGPPLHLIGRTTAGTTTVCDFRIGPGSLVGLAFASGNFDEDAFTHATTPDITRRPNRHLTFGIGPHICIGAPLARMEMRVVVDELLARTGTITPDGEPTEVGGLRSGYDRLAIRVTPA